MWRTCCALLLPIALAAQQRVSLDGAWLLRAELLDEPQLSRRTTTVPSAFETSLGTGFDGVAWYSRTLPLPADPCAHVRIEFSAIATHATVFCNGVEVGQHLGGWTPFRVDVTDALRWNGADLLEVRVDEKVGHNTQGFLPIIQPHFGGIWQSVTLCLDDGPVLDRLALFVFGKFRPIVLGNANGQLRFRVPVLGATPTDLRLVLEVLDGERVLAAAELTVAGSATGTLDVPGVSAWSPASPAMYTARCRLVIGARELDRVERCIGFRDLAALDTTVLWNGAPLQVRGILHWGYSPPHLAPPTDPAFWRRQLETFKALGFNCLKCCLWVPPRCVYELCDELGLLVWQEYPTWHPQMDQAHKNELLAEYAEFFAHDRNHPSVAFRSLTCETGHGADLDVVQALYDACKAAVPDTLVVDDSSWIGWQRVSDFWDEHPYGNNRWWPGRLREFEQHIQAKGRKPLLLGECIAADTWFDGAVSLLRWGEPPGWWQPDCLADQRRFETWVEQQFGALTLASLGPVSRDYAMRTRRYQIERLRMSLPEAGYVVSVARDFRKARMGLFDDDDHLKWPANEWSWHGDTMLCLDTEGDARAFVTSSVPVDLGVRRVVATTVGKRIVVPAPPAVAAPTRHRVEATVDGTRGAWDVWLLPPFDASLPASARVVDHLDEDTLTWLESGGRVLLQVKGHKHSVRSEAKWYLTGAPFAPPHPVHARLPAAMLVELQPFNLDGGRLVLWQPWLDQVDPILAFWETHDLAEVRAHLFAFDCNVGKGRLVASAFDSNTPAGRYVEHELLRHLADGPAAKRSLSPTTIAALRATLTEQRIELPVWRFRTDAHDEGRAANWQDPRTLVTTADWRDLRAGAHWESQAEDLRHYTGVAWYRLDVHVPASWRGHDARAVFDGVDDSFELWLNGEPAGAFGDAATKTTIWLERQVAELGQRLRPDATNTLVLRVVDHAGAGGIWKPACLTTGPADGGSQMLH